MAEMEILREVELKPYLWWQYTDNIFFTWEHGEEKLKEFIDVLNKKHPTIKFIAEWSKTQINFLDVTVPLENGNIKTDLYVKPIDTRQCLHSSSCHPCHCKKGIPYNQMLRLNWICSDSISFDRRCNDLERWLLDRGYKEKEVQKQVLRGRAICREDLLNREKALQQKTQIKFNLIYDPVFKNVRKILEELHLLLTPDQAHKKVFSEVPIIGFKNAKSLKDHFVRAVLPQLDTEDKSKPCEGANCSCEVCESVKDTTKFKKAESEETFDILRGPLDCNSNNVIYPFECKKCQFKFLYVSNTVTKFRFRFNNYKSTHRKFRKN